MDNYEGYEDNFYYLPDAINPHEDEQQSNPEQDRRTMKMGKENLRGPMNRKNNIVEGRRTYYQHNGSYEEAQAALKKEVGKRLEDPRPGDPANLLGRIDGEHEIYHGNIFSDTTNPEAQSYVEHVLEKGKKDPDYLSMIMDFFSGHNPGSQDNEVSNFPVHEGFDDEDWENKFKKSMKRRSVQENKILEQSGDKLKMDQNIMSDEDNTQGMIGSPVISNKPSDKDYIRCSNCRRREEPSSPRFASWWNDGTGFPPYYCPTCVDKGEAQMQQKQGSFLENAASRPQGPPLICHGCLTTGGYEKFGIPAKCPHCKSEEVHLDFDALDKHDKKLDMKDIVGEDPFAFDDDDWEKKFIESNKQKIWYPFYASVGDDDNPGYETDPEHGVAGRDTDDVEEDYDEDYGGKNKRRNNLSDSNVAALVAMGGIGAIPEGFHGKDDIHYGDESFSHGQGNKPSETGISGENSHEFDPFDKDWNS